MFLQQTNTADMLDLAVQYIKTLQSQLQVRIELDYTVDVKPCSSKQNPVLVSQVHRIALPLGYPPEIYV